MEGVVKEGSLACSLGVIGDLGVVVGRRRPQRLPWNPASA